MLSSILRMIAQGSRRIYVRVILIAMLNLIALAGAVLLGPVIPEGFGRFIGADAVDKLLEVLASSMLAVTTFSLTIMTAAFANAARNWTPRSYLVLRQDTVTHTVLATFLGSYLFALIAIILRAADMFGESGIVVLFGVTLLVIANIVYSIIRWIIHLEGLGSLPSTVDALEAEAARAMRNRVDRPLHGGRSLQPHDISQDALPLRATTHGYIQQFYEAALQSWAASHDAKIYVIVQVGQYVHRDEVLAHVTGLDRLKGDDALILHEAIPVRSTRGFDQDPAFGISVLAEVGTRALSPGINDPGTAIDILHRLAYVIGLSKTAEEPDPEPSCDRLWFRPLDPETLFLTSFDQISRSAGNSLEVQVTIQQALRAIADGSPAAVADAARACAARCRERAANALELKADRDRFAAAGGP